MGSHADAHADRSRRVGAWIARQGFHLLTGGGDGVMGAVSRAFVEVADRAGLVLAIVPSVTGDADHSPVPGYPNPWVEIPIYTHLDRGGPFGDEPTSRNHINVLTSTVVVVLPGGQGHGERGSARTTLRHAVRRLPALAGRSSASSRRDPHRVRLFPNRGIRHGSCASRCLTEARVTAVTNTGIAWLISSSVG